LSELVDTLFPVEIRFYVDPATGLPHLLRHGVAEDEALEVLAALRKIGRAQRALE
jgi:hypothetical protein